MASGNDLRDPAAGTTMSRDPLYSMWELPSTSVLLHATTRKNDVPSLSAIVRALRDPIEHLELLATTHARITGVNPGAAQSQWLNALRKCVYNFPSDFHPILETFPEETPSVDGADEDGIVPADGNTDTVKEKSRLDAFESIETYATLTAEQRLRLLHAAAEIAVCDPKLAPSAYAKASELGVDELRPGPFGYDEANVYWYFGDSTHLFREPDRRRKVMNTGKKKQQKDKKKLNEEKRKRIEERKKVAERKRAEKEERKKAAERKRAEKEERARKREEERERKRAEARAKWAPRHPNARVTRRSKAAAEAQLAAAMAVSKTEEEVEEVKVEEPVKTEETIIVSEPAIDDKTMKKEEEIIDVDAQQPSESESMLTVDPTVRACAGWECVCASLEELKAFAERFGQPEEIEHYAERKFVFRIWDELIPVFRDHERRMVREARKAMLNERRFVRKRSARVAALEARQHGERQAKKEARIAIQQQRDEPSGLPTDPKLDREARMKAREKAKGL